MCDSCSETADGRGRRCNRPDGVMSDAEKDRRNRTRNLSAAYDSLARGDAQAAANALAGARSAQQSLDGGPRVPVAAPSNVPGPQRDFYVSPSDAATAVERLQFVNRNRQQVGKPPLTVETTRQYAPTQDPIMASEIVTVRVSGGSVEELGGLSLGNVRTAPETRVNTIAVLEAACAATRLSGGRYVPAQEGSASVPAQVNAFINAAPGSPERKRLEPTREDKRMALTVRSWLRLQPATNDYMQSVQHAVTQEYMGLREAGTAASGIAGYQRYRERLERQRKERAKEAQQVVPGTSTPEPQVVSPRPTGSRWRGHKGHVHTFGNLHVEKVVEVSNPYRPQPSYLYIMRTEDGDLLRWMATTTQGMREGDRVTLHGQVKDHSMYNGEKQTELWYCKTQIHPPVVTSR